MVVIGPPAAADTGRMQERTAAPLKCTVHAPHWPMPQPNFGPLRSRTSRSTQRRGICGGTSTVADLPLTFSLKGMGSLPVEVSRGEIQPYKVHMGQDLARPGTSTMLTDELF